MYPPIGPQISQSLLSVARYRCSSTRSTAVSTPRFPMGVESVRSAEVRDHLFGEEAHRLRLRIVRGPRHETTAAHVDVGLDALGDLLGCADEVALAPRLERLAPHR